MLITRMVIVAHIITIIVVVGNYKDSCSCRCITRVDVVSSVNARIVLVAGVIKRLVVVKGEIILGSLITWIVVVAGVITRLVVVWSYMSCLTCLMLGGSQGDIHSYNWNERK